MRIREPGLVGELHTPAGRARGAVLALGGSEGGVEDGIGAALLAASSYPEHVCAVVAFAGSPVVWQGIAPGRENWSDPRSSWTAEGEPLPFVPYGRPDAGTAVRLIARRPPPLLRIYERAMRDEDAVARATMPLERIDGPVLLVSGGDDRMWPASRLAELALRRLGGRARHLSYAGAGHAAVALLAEACG